MPIVTVKNRYQVVIPRRVWERIGVVIGDRGIAEGLDHIKKGRVYGPYRAAAEAMKAFQARNCTAD